MEEYLRRMNLSYKSKTLLLAVILHVIARLANAKECPPSTMPHKGHCIPNNFVCLRNDASCYLLHFANLDWQMSYDFCKSIDLSSLIIVESQEENDAVMALIQEKTKKTTYWWLAGTEESHHNTWMWVTDEGEIPMSYTNWLSGQPNNWKGISHHLGFMVTSSGGGWFDAPHNYATAYSYSKVHTICEIKLVDCPYGSYNGYCVQKDFFCKESSCYFFQKKLYSWTEAQFQCKQMNLNLAVVQSLSENSFLEDKIKSSGLNGKFWLGGTDANHEGIWTWHTASGEIPITFSNWLSGEPNNAGGHEHYLYMWSHHDLLWNDATNYDKSFSICETKEMDCGNPRGVFNGTVSYDSSLHMVGIAVYKCDDGFILTGSETSRCLHDGSWSSQNQFCQAVDCGFPKSLPYGSIYYESTKYMTGIAVYLCNRGFRLNGDHSTLCTSTGDWSDQNQVCEEIKECSSNPCQNGGTCHELINGFNCECMVGYQGDFCSEYCPYGNYNGYCVQKDFVCKESSCYFLQRALYSWTEAQNQCQLMNLTLAVIESSSENSFLVDIIENLFVPPNRYDSIWFGGTNANHENEWVWKTAIGEKSITFSDWSPGKPSNRVGIAHYLCMSRLYDLKWNNLLNSEKEFSICETKKMDCGNPRGVFNGTVRYDSTLHMVGIAVYECDPGFILTGSETALCMHDGAWSIQDQFCQDTTTATHAKQIYDHYAHELTNLG